MLVGQLIDLSIKNCQLHGAPSRRVLEEGLALRLLMAITPHTNVTISDSKLSCQFSPLVPV
jgi:hypothetical protein